MSPRMRSQAENQKPDNCLCDSQSISYAMAYVKSQSFGEIYPLCDGWKRGTIFPALDLPYSAGGCKR